MAKDLENPICFMCGCTRYPLNGATDGKLDKGKGRRLIDRCEAPGLPNRMLCRKCQMKRTPYVRVKEIVERRAVPKIARIQDVQSHLNNLEFELPSRIQLQGHDLMMDIFCERFLSLADEVNLVFQEAHHLRGNQDCSQAEILSYESHKRNKNNATHYML